MGKKIPLLISTLTLAASSLAPAAAWADEPSKTAWTYDEMAALNIEYEKEVAENCADDMMCAESYIYTKSEDIYRALNHYRNRGLTITAIDPTRHTIRVIYDSDILSRWSPDKLTLKDLAIVQGEIGYYVPGSLVSAIENSPTNGLEHIGTIFFKNDANASEVWFPSNTEVEFFVPELASLDETGSAEELQSSEPLTPTKYRPALDVSYRMSNPYAAWDDYFNFSECLDGLDEGKECQIMYGVNNTFYAAVVARSSSVAELSEPASAGGLSTDALADVASHNAPSLPLGTSIASTVSDVPSAPDTGQATAPQEGSTEFPWWLGVIFAAGLGTLVWFFWPKAKKSPKKS